MHGSAAAPGAGTVVNALATGNGAAFALDLDTTATVELDPESDHISGRVMDKPQADTTLIERCVELATDRYGQGEGGMVQTESELPMAAGLKSSSAAANATVLATLAALDRPIEDADLGSHITTDPDPPSDRIQDGSGGAVGRLAACRLGVEASRDTGVTVTGAFDDASASMLGGVAVTDNENDELLAREPFDRRALIWTPPERAYTADADVEACKRVAPMADLATDLALAGEYGRGMTVNGLAFSAALDFPAAPAVEAMSEVEGVSLSGTGPSVVAVGERSGLEAVRDQWETRPGTTRMTATTNKGGRIT